MELRGFNAEIPLMSLDRPFPIRHLLFFVAQDVTSIIRSGIYSLVTDLAMSREWVIAPPQFVNDVETLDEAELKEGNVPFETVGGILETYSMTPPTVLPREVNMALLEEVSALVNAVCDFSRNRSVNFQFELDGDCIGNVDGGEMDSCLEEVFFGEWKRYLGVSG
jgi:hypothetical protein